MPVSTHRPMLVFSTLLEANQFMSHFVKDHELVWSFSHHYGYSLMDQPFKLTCVVTGLKPEQAEKAIEAALERFADTTFVLGLGVCSALIKTASIGDLCIPNRIKLENDQAFILAHAKMTFLENLGVQNQSKVLKALYTCKDHLPSVTDKAAVHVASHCDAYDTSSAAWVKAVLKRDMACVIFKTVMDTGDEFISEDLLNCMDKFGDLKMKQVTLTLLKKPYLYTMFQRFKQNAIKNLLSEQAEMVKNLIQEFHDQDASSYKKTVERENPQLSLLNPSQ